MPKEEGPLGNNIAKNGTEGLQTEGTCSRTAGAGKLGDCLLKKTVRIAASWEEGVNQSESGASDAVKALTAFVLCTPSPHTEDVQMEIQLTGFKIARKLLFCFRSLFQQN